MNISTQELPLMVQLKSLDDIYYGKVLELRDAVQEWLSYIPETFPHYTRHTIKHSEEIIVQISKLIFKDHGEPSLIQLSPAEIYILIASAYLHDSGMVSADREKLEILMTNSEWQNWISGEGGGAKRWIEIEDIRKGRRSFNESARNFVADLQTRYLLAEFIRRTHHIRAADVINQYQNHLGRFAFGDPMMQRTISDVCVSHGLVHYELYDSERYPLRRDIQGHAVNVRLLAILLRLGDLLDMSYDRACPLLMNAANPLPADSFAHWTQYQRIIHRATSPDRIEITAECLNQEEHRLLQDWCQWIVEEAREAKGLMSHAELHHDWRPPTAVIEGPDATIKIRRAKNANYIPSNWSFKIDQNAVLNILIRDVYKNPIVFLRELIQNALDASRCQMYADLGKDGLQTPEYPTRVEPERRNRYPIKLKLEVLPVVNELSGENEDRQMLTIEDYGIGMDREIITRFFLQIGRSYYATEEFRRSFDFIPTSHFGVGFLSVFAVSDHVAVDTYKPYSSNTNEPIHMTLRGPRNYLLTELSERRVSGTKIEVLLREPIDEGNLTRHVSGWCRRVEFPIQIDDLGVQTTILAESSDQFIDEKPNLTAEGGKFIIRAFPIERTGIEGEIYVFAKVDDLDEHWDFDNHGRIIYRDAHPQASLPEVPTDLICLHGIAQDPINSYRRSSLAVRLDYRGLQYKPTVSRENRQDTSDTYDLEVISRCTEILTEHLKGSKSANSKDGWKYKQRLVAQFPFPSFWASIPEMIPIYTQGQFQLIALNTAIENGVLTTVLKEWFPPYHRNTSRRKIKATTLKAINTPVIIDDDLTHISADHRESLFESRSATNIRWIDGCLAIDWIPSADRIANEYDLQIGELTYATDLPDSNVIGLVLKVMEYQNVFLLNAKHPITAWLKALEEACVNKQYNFSSEHFERTIGMLRPVAEYDYIGLDELNNYFDKWLAIPELPEKLYPPMTVFTREMFKPIYQRNKRLPKEGAKKRSSQKRK